MIKALRPRFAHEHAVIVPCAVGAGRLRAGADAHTLEEKGTIATSTFIVSTSHTRCGNLGKFGLKTWWGKRIHIDGQGTSSNLGKFGLKARWALRLHIEDQGTFSNIGTRAHRSAVCRSCLKGISTNIVAATSTSVFQNIADTIGSVVQVQNIL